MTGLNLWAQKNFLSRHASKVKDEVGLQKIEKKNKQFLTEKILSEIEKKNPYSIETEYNLQACLPILIC